MSKGKRGSGAPYLRGRIYWIKYYADGKPIYESTGTSSKSEAVKVLNRKRAEVDRGEVSADKCRIDYLLALHVHEQRRLQRADIDHVEARVRNHLAPAVGHIFVNRLATKHVESYVDGRPRAAAAPATINRSSPASKQPSESASSET